MTFNLFKTPAIRRSGPTSGSRLRAFACTLAGLCLLATTFAPSPAAANSGSAGISIAIVGDSIARGYCRGLKRHLKPLSQVSLHCWTKPSSGLTRLDFFNWNDELRSLLPRGKVDYAIISMGANDAQDMTLKNRIVRFSDPAWGEVYRARVDDMIDLFKANGTDVFWIGMPIARSKNYTSKMAKLNRIYTDASSSRGATFISLWEFTQEASGRYTRVLPGLDGRPQLARAKDGIHFNRTGERIVSCHIWREMGLTGLEPGAGKVC